MRTKTRQTQGPAGVTKASFVPQNVATTETYKLFQFNDLQPVPTPSPQSTATALSQASDKVLTRNIIRL